MNALLLKNYVYIIILVALLGFPVIVFAQNVSLNTQADVDAFDPSTTVVMGTLLIGETGNGISDIVDIGNLSSIERVHGDLIISRNVNLFNIDELSNLARIGGYLSVTTNENLRNIDGLSNLVRMGFRKDLIIYENNRLENLDGLVNLSADVDILRIFNNTSLQNLDGLNSIETIQSIEIEFNVSISRIDGFDSLKEIASTTVIRGNLDLDLLAGFNNVERIGSFSVSENPSLTNIDIFSSEDTLRGGLSIFNNEALISINGFDDLNHITGSFVLFNSPELESIVGLTNLASVGGDLRISRTGLSDVDALGNLISVGGIMAVISNSSLGDCCAILSLVENREIAIGDTLFIDNNSFGCDTIPEILEIGCNLRFTCSASPPCVGGQNGALQIFVSDYVSLPFTYTWQREEDNSMGSGMSDSDDFIIDMLYGGTYNITVTTPRPDSAFKTDIILLESPGSQFEIVELTSSNSSNGLGNGSISLNTSGGVEPYFYSWSGVEEGSQMVSNSTGFTITGLSYGAYTVSIVDGNGSTVTVDVTLLDDDVQVINCNEPLDIIILNDVSSSVDALEYRESQKFFIDLLKAVNIGNGVDDSRGTIVEWASTSEVKIPITGDISLLEDYRFVNRTFEGMTFPIQAMNFAKTYLEENGREDVEKVIVLATDGYQNQIPSSLVALADQLKAEGYHIITIAFDAAFTDLVTRERLQSVASVDILAPGAPSYSQLDENLAEDIVGIYLCPIDPGSASTAYFNRDGEIDIIAIQIIGNCPFPESLEATIDVSAYKELSIPFGTPITFYHNNPELSGATSIFTWYVPCAIPVNTTETFTISLPINAPTNLFAVLNDDGIVGAPINFPVTEIEEIAFSNNIDSERICADGTGAVQAFKYASLPSPACDTMVNYTIDVCNVSEVDVFGVTVTDISPPGFELVNTLVDFNGCAAAIDSTYNIPSDCCFSLYLTYDAAGAANGYYGNQGVNLSGELDQTYLSFDGTTTTAEDVNIDGSIDCPSTNIEFVKSVNITETCDDSFVEFMFTINNELNIPLQGLVFSDILPAPCEWTFMPYNVNGMTLSDVSINGAEVTLTIEEVQANTIASFSMDAFINTWPMSGTLNNMATLDNVPDAVNGGLVSLSSNITTTQIITSPLIELQDTILIDPGKDFVEVEASVSSDATINWTTQGDGSFGNINELITTYYLGDSDKEMGEVTLFISVESECNQSGQSVVLILKTCELALEILDLGACNNMGTPFDGTDDIYDLTFMVTNHSLFVDSPVEISFNNQADTIEYFEEHTILFPADGVTDILTALDIEYEFCSDEIAVNQDLCTEECVLLSPLENIIINECDDNGTPRDSTDDFYTINFMVDSHNGSAENTFNISFDGDNEGPFMYGELAVLTLPADGIVDSILITDTAMDSCTIWLVVNQGNCYSFEPCADGLSEVAIEESIISSCEEYEAILMAVVEVEDTFELMYSWTDASGNELSEDNFLEVTEAGLYNLQVRYCDEFLNLSTNLNIDPGGLLMWPKVFFPNGLEEENKTFGPYSSCNLFISDYTLKIYNKWGNEVFVSSDINDEWDGTHKGKKSASAVYVFVAEYTLAGIKQDVFKGDVTLLR